VQKDTTYKAINVLLFAQLELSLIQEFVPHVQVAVLLVKMKPFALDA
jgi:hypothetical protein